MVIPNLYLVITCNYFKLKQVHLYHFLNLVVLTYWVLFCTIYLKLWLLANLISLIYSILHVIVLDIVTVTVIFLEYRSNLSHCFFNALKRKFYDNVI